MNEPQALMQHPEIQCRVRVARGVDIAVGPGKMELLEAIRDAGSISGGARRMGMSYRRAWMLVETMNSCFVEPLVVTATGGRSGGGARLTPRGEEVLRIYAAMMTEVEAVARRHLDPLMPALLSKAVEPGQS